MFSNDFIGAKVSAGMKRGAQPGNLNALKHGFYSKHFQKAVLQDLEEARDLHEEIAMMRVVTRQLLKMARGCKEIGELVNVLGALGLASTRVAGLMKVQKYIGGNVDNNEDQLRQAIHEITRDWPIVKALEGN